MESLKALVMRVAILVLLMCPAFGVAQLVRERQRSMEAQALDSHGFYARLAARSRED